MTKPNSTNFKTTAALRNVNRIGVGVGFVEYAVDVEFYDGTGAGNYDLMPVVIRNRRCAGNQLILSPALVAELRVNTTAAVNFGIPERVLKTNVTNEESDFA